MMLRSCPSCRAFACHTPADAYGPHHPRCPLAGAAATRSAALGAVPTTIRPIPDGFAGTSATIAEMIRLAVDAFRDERINALAREVTIGCPPRAWLCEAAALLRWMQRTFRYTRLPTHPDGLQRVQTPSYTLFDAPERTGECASLSTALAALLLSLGAEVRFRTSGPDASRPDHFEHVYIVVHEPSSGWIPADPSYDAPLGWEHPSTATRLDWPLR